MSNTLIAKIPYLPHLQNESKILIFVKMMISKTYLCYPKMKIIDLKQLITLDTGICIEQQQLFYVGQILYNYKTFEDFNIRDCSVLQIIINYDDR